MARLIAMADESSYWTSEILESNQKNGLDANLDARNATPADNPAEERNNDTMVVVNGPLGAPMDEESSTSENDQSQPEDDHDVHPR